MKASEELLLKQERSRIKAVMHREEGKTLEEHEGNREYERAVEEAMLAHEPLMRFHANHLLNDLPEAEKHEVLVNAFRRALHGYDAERKFGNYFYSYVKGAGLNARRAKRATRSIDAPFKGQGRNLHDVIPDYDEGEHERVLESARKAWETIVSQDKLRDVHAQVILRPALFNETQASQGKLLGVGKPVTRQRVAEHKKDALYRLKKKGIELKLEPGKFDASRFYTDLFSELPYSPHNEELFNRILRSHGEDAAYLAARISKVFRGSKRGLSEAAENLFLSRKSAGLIYNRLLGHYPELGEPFKVNPTYAESSRKRRQSDEEVEARVVKAYAGRPVALSALPRALHSLLCNRPGLVESLRKKGLIAEPNAGLGLSREEALSRLNKVREVYREKGRPIFRYSELNDVSLSNFVLNALRRGHPNLTGGELTELRSMISKQNANVNRAPPADKRALKERLKEIEARLKRLGSKKE